MDITCCFDKENLLQKKASFSYLELPAEEVIEKDSFLRRNFLVFNLQGRMECIFNGIAAGELSENKMIFLAASSNCRLSVKEPVQLLLVGFNEFPSSCDKFIFQALCPIQETLQYEFNILDIRYSLNCFFFLQKEYMASFLLKTDLFEEKLKELFILLRAYYLKEELAMFFYEIIGKNIDFKNNILINFKYGMCLEELAEMSHCSVRVFQRRFKEVFGESLERWILREKSKLIRHYLSVSDLSFKEIIDRLGFDSAVHLNKFCKTWFGMSPTQLRKTMMLQRNMKS